MAQLAMATQILGAFSKGKTALDGFEKAAKIATAGLSAMTTAGFVGTAEGNRLAEATKQLSQTFASFFIPVVEKVSDALEGFNNWLDRSGGSLQDAFGKLVNVFSDVAASAAEDWAPMLETAMEALADVLRYVVVPILQVFAEVVKGINSAVAFVAKFSPANLLGEGVVGATEALGGQKKHAMDRVTLAGGKFEDVTASFKRIQSTISRTEGAGKSVPEQQLNAMEKQLAELSEIRRNLVRTQPVVGS